MSFRTYNYEDFKSIDDWTEVKFNYRRDTQASEKTAAFIETFATGPFLVTLNTIVFDKEIDAVIFTLWNEE